MSVISCLIGQCGNQLGQTFYDKLSLEAVRSDPQHQLATLDSFFSLEQSDHQSKITANSIMIDMEPKVIENLLTQQSPRYHFSPQNSFYQQEGSGNNWAYGFNHHGPNNRAQMINLFRKEFEKHDFIEGMLFAQSMAGGTGSGLGSYMLQELREAGDNLSSKVPIFTAVVMPRMTGEVILQFYNSVFSLATLHEHADGIIFLENDKVSMLCNKLYGIKKPDLKDMNQVLAKQLTSMMFPVLNSSAQGAASSKSANFLSKLFNPFQDTCQALLLNPYCKLLNLRTVPQMPETSKSFSKESWNALEKRVFQMAIGGYTECDINWGLRASSKRLQKAVGYIGLMRGDDMKSLNKEGMFDFQAQNSQIYTNKAANYLEYKDQFKYDNNDKSISLISNTQENIPILDFVSEKAHQMFLNNAYLHHYEKNGLEKDQIIQFLASVEQVAKSYKDL